MRLRLSVLAALLLSAAASPGCARSRKATEEPAHPAVAIPAEIRDLDAFAEHRNAFALLAEDHPQRSAIRERLVDFLVGYLEQKVDEEHYGEAVTALDFIVALYNPRELRSDERQPAIARAAHRVYRAAARRGNESPAMLSLAIEQHFGDDRSRRYAVAQWRDLEEWILRNGVFSEEALLRHEELEETLEETASVFPSPFVVGRLHDLYIARYQAAVAALDRSPELSVAARQRAEVTGYLLVRLHLRADDFAGTLDALSEIEPDLATRKIMEFIREAETSERSAGPLLTLATQFIPESPDEYSRIPPSFFVQGWGIVTNLAQRALRRFPEDPYAHLLRARALRQDGLLDAAIHHYEAALRFKEDLREGWEELAVMQQMSLERLADRDPEAAEIRLAELERLHRRAAELWPERPIRPGLPEAYVVVAHGLYNSGKIQPAQALLTRSLAIEPVAEALYLLGTIELKRGELKLAKGHFEGIVALPHDNQRARLRWETKVHTHLSEIASRQGDAKRATEHRQSALRQLNSLIAFPSLDEAERSAYLLDRGKLFLLSGDLVLAMADFRQARLTTPESSIVYTEPMLLIVSHGYYEEAREIYQQLLARDEIRDTLKLYFSLWIADLALRQGREDPEAAAFLATYKADTWPHKLALHALGKLGFDELVKAAADDGERAEAYFYEALRLLRRGDGERGRELMKRVIASGMMSFFEYDMALHYLAQGEPPRQRPPSP